MTASNETYDIVFTNGRVIDPETYRDGKFNVGIIDGTIAAISDQPLKGKEVVDVSGMIVSPGFIDLHAHGQNIAEQSGAGLRWADDDARIGSRHSPDRGVLRQLRQGRPGPKLWRLGRLGVGAPCEHEP